MKLVFGTFVSPVLAPLYRAVAVAVGRGLEYETEFVVGTSYRQLSNGEIDIAFICGRPFVELAHGPDRVRALVAPVVAGERYGGLPVYFSDVVVRAESELESFADLRGSRWCFNEIDSHSGYGVVLNHLEQMRESTAFFDRFEAVGSHTEALWLVASGTYDAAAIDSHLLDVIRWRSPEALAELRVVETLGPSPIQPLVAAATVASEVQARVRAALLEPDDEELAATMQAFLVERFVSVDDETYDDIRATSELSAIETSYP